MNGSRRKYVDRKCLLCSRKFVLIYIYIYIYAYIYIHVMFIHTYIYIYKYKGESKFLCGCPRGVMVKAMDYGIVVHEFVLQSRYYVHFRLIPWERYEPPYPPSYGLNITTTVLLGE